MKVFKPYVFLLSLLLQLKILQAEIVEIVSSMYTEEILAEPCFRKVKEAYELRITDQKYHLPISDYHYIKRFLIFNGHDHLHHLNNCPVEKKVLFMMEPSRFTVEQMSDFSRVYTWDDDAIDNKKF